METLEHERESKWKRFMDHEVVLFHFVRQESEGEVKRIRKRRRTIMYKEKRKEERKDRREVRN